MEVEDKNAVLVRVTEEGKKVGCRRKQKQDFSYSPFVLLIV